MNPKAKGSSFERAVCKALSLWISSGEREDLFWRSAMSGGRSTVAAKGGTKLNAQCGDITSVDPLGNVLTDDCYFECKHLKRCSLDDLVKDNFGRDALPVIWGKACREADKYNNRHPVLIFRQNRWPTMVCMGRPGVDFFGAQEQVLVSARPYGMCFVRLDDLIAKPFRGLAVRRKRK